MKVAADRWKVKVKEKEPELMPRNDRSRLDYVANILTLVRDENTLSKQLKLTESCRTGGELVRQICHFHFHTLKMRAKKEAQ